MELIQLTQDYDLKPFDCGDADLNGFLLNDAKTFLEKRLGKTFLLLDGENIVAYCCLFAVQAIGDAPDGEIRLSAYCDDQDRVCIEVSNNGPKIASEVAGQMFVPFFTTKEDGSGIGLSLSKQIMRLQGGSISLLPYRNEWTTFVVVL